MMLPTLRSTCIELCKQHRTIKSDKVCIADSTVIKQITWPHELMYTAGGQPAIYEELLLPLFVTGYLSILVTVKAGQKEVMLKHLRELMMDVKKSYGWKPIQAYHSQWL